MSAPAERTKATRWQRARARTARMGRRVRGVPRRVSQWTARRLRRVDWVEMVKDLHVYGGLALATWAGYQVGGHWSLVGLGSVLFLIGLRSAA